MARCPAVVHFARFEAPFLHDLHAQVLPAAGFPLELICTHEISRRLFPNLPRRSIRAISGYGLFCDRYGKRSRTVTPHRFIFELGGELWTRTMVEEVADTDGPVDLELRSITVRSWTPDAVCGIIGSNIARAAHEMRLARWFALLCEAALGWEEYVGKDRLRFGPQHAIDHESLKRIFTAI